MKYLEILEQTLNEINMSPSSLRQAAAGIDALAGMEFEMIIPGAGSEELDPEYEPDWDRDERTRSFSNIRDFFHDGDYNGRREVDNLMEEIEAEYAEWKQEQIDGSWDSEGIDYLRDYIANNDSFDRDEAMQTARDEIMDANPDLPPESEEFSQLLSARLDEMEEEFVQKEFADQGRIYNDAFEEFTDEKQSEDAEEEFLEEKYPYMTEVQSNFDISWPHYYDINADIDNEATTDVEQVGDEFSSFMGKPVNTSDRYHGATRKEGHYVVEPDGSLEGDNPGDGGLEFVSPPMPVAEMLADLKKVKAWADKVGAYTNDSTGLHINVSVPGFSMEKLDFVKLAILLGDERVLNEFGRMGNTYAKSALQIVKQNIKQRPEDAEALLAKMKEHLSTAAAKSIHSGTTAKFTSINTKTGYIEFRSPGGDWLDTNFELIEPTLLRFVVALDAALDETKYQTEYAKKLYKLLAPGSDEPGILQLFANYSAGELPKDALIRQVRQQQLARDVNKGKAPAGQQYWWNVQWDANRRIEVVASNKNVARQVAAEEWDVPVEQLAVAKVTMLRPYEPSQEQPAAQSSGPTLNGRPSNTDGNYVIVDTADEQTPVYRYMAANSNDALSVLRQWISTNPGTQWNFKFDPSKIMGQPAAQQQSAAQPSAGNWGIWIDSSGRFARQPNTVVADNVLRRFPSRAAAMAFLERTREENPQMRTDVEVREIPADYTPGSRPMGQASEPIPGSTLDLQRRRADAYQSVPIPGVTDVELDIPLAQQSAGATAPRTLTTPGQGQQRFTGEWKIVDANDRELHRFGGVGNVQADANRIAMTWLRAHPAAMQSGVQVLPVME